MRARPARSENLLSAFSKAFANFFRLAAVSVSLPVAAIHAAPELREPFSLIQLDQNGEKVISLSESIFDPNISGSTVRVSVRMGENEKNFDLLLFDDEAPKTVANFLRHIETDAFLNNIVHRSVPGFIVQTGGFRLIDETTFGAVPTFDPVENEPGISNTRGTIAMAKIGGDPNSATSQWFVNLGDNSANLDAQNGGFTVFGKVLGDGMEVVDEIEALQVWDASPFHGAWTDLPLYGFEAGDGLQRSHLIEVNLAEIDPISFSATSENPDLLSVELEGSDLILRPFEGEGGEAEVRITATALDGSSSQFSISIWIGETFESWAFA